MKTVLPFLTILILVFFGCKGQYQRIDSFERSNVDSCKNGEKIIAFSNNFTKYLNSNKTDYKDSLIDEIFINFHGFEPKLYDTIRTETIRRVVNDSILFSGEVPSRIVNKLNIESLDHSVNRKCFTLIYKLKVGDHTYRYQYDIHHENYVKTSSDFKFLSKD